MMHVAFVSSGLDAGGAEIALLRLTKAMREHGIAPTAVSLRGLGTVGPMLQQASIDVLPLGLPALSSLAVALPRLSSFLRSREAALMHGWMYHGNLVALAAGRRLGLPVVWGIRQSLLGAQDSWLTRRVIDAGAFLSRNAQLIVYNSTAGRAQHEARGYDASRGVVMPNGFDTERFRPDDALRASVRARLGIPADASVVAQVARFHPGKDYPGLLRAAATIASARPDATFLLIGNGVDEGNAELMELVRQLELGTRVRMLGHRDDVADLLAAVDVVILNSTAEGFPNSLAEAMCCGVPCVGTAVGDVPELIGDTGEVVPASDPGALAAAVVRLLSLDESARRALGARARERIVEKYSIDEIARRYADLLLAVARPRH
jgi:glycosyltransferase involved in cell wall biosynthesis